MDSNLAGMTSNSFCSIIWCLIWPGDSSSSPWSLPESPCRPPPSWPRRWRVEELAFSCCQTWSSSFPSSRQILPILVSFEPRASLKKSNSYWRKCQGKILFTHRNPGSKSGRMLNSAQDWELANILKFCHQKRTLYQFSGLILKWTWIHLKLLK